MRFPDAASIAVHNIRHNPGRTLLTVLIVTVVSGLVMFLMALGLSFHDNLTRASLVYFNDHGANYALRPLDPAYGGTGELSREEYEVYRANAEKYPDARGDDLASGSIDAALTLRSADGGSASPAWSYALRDLAGKSFASVPADVVFYEGRVWTPADSASRNLFLSRTLTQYVEKQTGHTLHAGEEVCLCGIGEVRRYTVAGIFSCGDEAACILGIDEFFSLAEDPGFSIRVDLIEMKLRPVDAAYDFNSLYDHMRALTKATNAGLTQPDTFLEDYPELRPFYDLFGGSAARFTCDFADAMSVLNILSSIVVAVFFLLALAVLLLSVSSVANSVVISVDKNRKFFGMLKAVGLDAKGTRAIVYIELLLIVFVGVILGMGILFALTPLLSAIIASLFSYLLGSISSFTNSAIAYVTRVTLPFWVPLATIAFFLLLTMLFSRGSIQKIATQDVMATLSEVE